MKTGRETSLAGIPSTKSSRVNPSANAPDDVIRPPDTNKTEQHPQAIAASRTPLWLPSGWGCRGRWKVEENHGSCKSRA
jgi:hypothetical protein